jgi:ADP-heptose:LPS heptosyltransferase
MPTPLSIKRIIISRPDAIGDVILTLPVCGLIKKYFPFCEVIFLGKTYTKEVIACCEYVDEFLNADDLLNLDETEAAKQLKAINADCIIHVFPNKRIAKLAKQAGIKLRVGTTNRLFHWTTVNKLIPLSRKNSDLHESQLNCKLLQGIGISDLPELSEMYKYIGFTKLKPLSPLLEELIDKNRINVILHPKSNASAREWSLERYKQLIILLPHNKYKIFISGSDKEKLLLADWINALPSEVADITGKLSLSEFISFINNADVLVAASTGPLHIASACGIYAIGIYPPIKPMHPERWKPIGKHAVAVSENKTCNACKKNPQQCSCMNNISAQQIASLILSGSVVH